MATFQERESVIIIYIKEGKRLLKEKQYRGLLAKIEGTARRSCIVYRFKLGKGGRNLSREYYKNMGVYSWLQKKYQCKMEGWASGIERASEAENRSDIIWWCWLQGEENAPALCKACLASLKRHFPDKKINIVTYGNMADYVALPEHIIRKHRRGIITHAHFSDILRISLLAKHGGVWIDSTVFCTGRPVYMFERPLFVYQNENDEAITISNWLISAERMNPIILMTQKLLFDYWENHNYSIHYYLFHMLFHMAAECYEKEWRKVPFFSNRPPHVLQAELLYRYTDGRYKEITQMSDMHKLTYKLWLERREEDSFYDYIIGYEEK